MRSVSRRVFKSNRQSSTRSARSEKSAVKLSFDLMPSRQKPRAFYFAFALTCASLLDARSLCTSPENASSLGTRWRSEVNSNCRYRFVNSQHQVKLCDIRDELQSAVALQRISSALWGAGSDRKLACPFIGSLLRHQSRCRSSRTRGRSPPLRY